MLAPPPVKKLAIDKGIKVLQPKNVKDDNFLTELSAMKPDLIVVVAYGKILPEYILELPPLKCINVHASLLPKYRGASPIARSIINGEKKTGITTMLMDEGLDTGDILLQEEIEISGEDTTDSLSKKLSELGASLLIKTIRGIRDGSVKPKPQTGEASYAPILKKEDGRIDWSKSASELFNFIRGMHPWPCAYCYLNKERIKIIKVKALDGSGKAGKIEKAGNGELIVGTGKGLLSIVELQPEGKKSMSALPFIQGRHLKEGLFFDES